MTEIRLSANGGAPQLFDSGVDAATALRALLSNKERKNTVAVCLGERLLDLSTRLTADGDLQTVAVDSPAGLDILRHSAAHIMAQAVLDIFGKAVKVAIGPSIADGFYYDFDRGEPFTPEDLEKIEQRMSEIVQQAKTFERSTISVAEAVQLFGGMGQPYKVELLEEMEGDTVSLYRQGDFVDLCRGPHVPDTSWVKAFKLVSLAGAYWRGNEKNQMLQRIYGTAFADPKALRKHLANLEEAKKTGSSKTRQGT